MPETIAHGIIEIDLHDEGALAGLKRVGRSFDDLQDEVSGKETILDLKADVDNLKKDLTKAKKAVKEYEGWKKKEYDKASTVDKARNTKAIKAEKARVASLEDLIDTQGRLTTAVDTHVKKMVLQGREATKSAKAQAAAAKQAGDAEEDLQAVIDRVAKEYEKSRQGKRKALDRELADAARNHDRREAIHSAALASDLKFERARQEAATKVALALDKATRRVEDSETELEVAEGKITKLMGALRGLDKVEDDLARTQTYARTTQRALNDELDRERPNREDIISLTEEHNAALIDQAVAQERLTKQQRDVAVAYNQESNAAERLRAIQEAELARVPQLENQYQRLEARLQKVSAEKDKLRKSDPGRVTLQLEQGNIIAQLEALRRRVVDITGREPVPLYVEPRLSQRAGSSLNASFKDAFRNNSNLIALAAAVGGDIGAHAGRGVVGRYKTVVDKGLGNATRQAAGAAVRGVGSIIESAFHRLGRLSDVTARIGPFTTTIRTAAFALSVFAPLLIDVAGALGTLVGSLGAATLGVGALAAGFLGGLIPAAIGMFAVIKPVVAQFKQAATVRKAYNDALAKGNEKLAAKKLKELQSVLGNVDAGTAKSIASWDKLKDAWTKITSPARASAFHTIGEGIRFANRNVETFGKNTNETAKQLDKGITGFLRNLDTSAFDMMHDNFNSAIKPMTAGLGNLINYFARVGRAASFWIPGLATSFEGWSKGLLNTTENAGDLQKRVDGVVNSARNMGRFFMAAGRLVKAFFGQGVSAGDDFVSTMTNAFNRWTLFINSNPAKFKSFFAEAVRGAQSLYAVLAPLVSTFIEWSALLAPFARALSTASAGVTQFAAGLLQVTALQGPLSALVSTLGALFAVNRIRSAGTAMAGFASALFGLSKGGKAVAAANVAGAVAGAAGGAVRGAAVAGASTVAGARVTQTVAGSGAAATRAAAGMNAAAGAAGAATTKVGALRAAATLLIPRIATMGTIAGGAASLGVGVLAGAAVYGAFKLATMKSSAEKLADEFKNQRIAARGAGWGYVQLRNNLDSTAVAARQGALSVKQARAALKDTKKGTTEYAQALLNLRSAEQFAHDSRRQFITEREAMEKSADVRFKSRVRERVAAQKGVAEEEENAIKRGVPAWKLQDAAYLAQNKHLVELRSKLHDARVGENDAANSRAASLLAGSRAYKGFSEVVGNAEQRLGALARRSSAGKQIAVKIATKIENPQDVGRVAANATNALKAGVKKSIILDIVANSRSVDQTLARLKAASLDPKTLSILEEGGDDTLDMMRLIKGTPLGTEEIKLGQKGGPEVLRWLANILGIRIPRKLVVIDPRDNAAQQLASYRAQNGSTVSTQYIDIWQRLRGRVGGHRLSPSDVQEADGGVRRLAAGGSVRPNPRQQARAAQTARLSGTRPLRSGTYKNPTLLVGEEHRTEDVIVISRNPAYRERNKGYLKQAASALGMTVEDGRDRWAGAAAGGKGNKSRPKPTLARGRSIVQGRLKKKAKPKLPPRLENFIGPVEIGDLRGIKLEADRKYEQAAKKRSDYEGDIKKEKDPKKRKTMQEKLASGKGALPTKSEVAKLKYIKESVSKVFNRASKAREKFDTMEHQIDVYWKAMETLSETENPKMNKQGVPMTDVPGVGMKDYNWILNQWQTLAGKKTTLLNSSLGDFKKHNLLGTKMGRAMQLAVGEAQLAEVQDPPKWEAEAPETATLDQAIQESGNQPKLGALLKAAALARTTNDKGVDDKERAEDLRKFYVGLEPIIKGMPKYNNDEVLTELYDRIGNYSDFDAASDSGPTNDQLAVQQRQNDITIADLRGKIVDQTVSGIGSKIGDLSGLGLAGATAQAIQQVSAPVRAPQAAGAASAGSLLSGTAQQSSFASEAVQRTGIGNSFAGGPIGGTSGGAPGVTVNINTLHPGDPNTLQAIGDAATAGMGFQNPVPSPRGSIRI